MIRRIELDVFGNNVQAINLYHKIGFIVDGNRKLAVKLYNGEFVDLIHMSMTIAQQGDAPERFAPGDQSR